MSSHQVETLATYRRFHVERVSYELPGGQAHRHDLIRHPGSVVIVPHVDEDHICLIRNFRVAVDRTLVELPAGTRESGEDPDLTAQRELIEETGYRAQRIDRRCAFFAAPGILDEKMILYEAFGLAAGEPAREWNEQIENLVVSWSDARAMVERGEIEDAKTLVGLMLTDPNRPGNAMG